jgi:pimeloyl-ACP methyl ester carboxylesterase
MNRRLNKILRWSRWTLLTLILLPVISLLFMKLTGSVKMRKSDDQILGLLYSYPIIANLDTAIIGDRQITYLITRKEEKKKKEAIIFVHGSPGSLDAFLEYMHNDSLLSIADLISYDRPGFGHSDFGKSLPSLRGQVRILKGLMNELGYDRYWLIGHSYGGSIIIQACIDRIPLIAGVGIIAGSVTYDMEPVAGWRKWFDLPFIRPIMPTALRVSNDELKDLRGDLRMIDDDWAEIKQPVTIIHGTKDILVPFENLELAKQKLTHSDSVRTLIFEDENHFILWTKTGEIVKEIVSFIQANE